MDGATFYRIAGDWAKLTTGIPIEAMTVDQSLILDAAESCADASDSRIAQTMTIWKQND